MANENEIKDFVKDTKLIIDEVENLKEKHKDIFKEFCTTKRIITEEDRNELAKEMIKKYSNL